MDKKSTPPSRGERGVELLYPHQISARIHGVDDRLVGFDRHERLVRASGEAAPGEAAPPAWLEQLELENQRSIAFMAKLISGRPDLALDDGGDDDEGGQHRFSVGIMGRAPRRHRRCKRPSCRHRTGDWY